MDEQALQTGSKSRRGAGTEHAYPNIYVYVPVDPAMRIGVRGCASGTGGRTNGRTDGRADGRAGGRAGGRTGGRAGGRADGRADGIQGC